MNYSTCNEPVALPNEHKCCCTPDSPNREVSMAEQLDKTQTALAAAVEMLERLDAYIFAVTPTEGLGMPHPECMRDAIYNNEYLASLVEERLKKLVDRICV